MNTGEMINIWKGYKEEMEWWIATRNNPSPLNLNGILPKYEESLAAKYHRYMS